MARGTTTPPSQKHHRTLILPIEQEEYHVILDDILITLEKFCF
jgi:hypothetical protein